MNQLPVVDSLIFRSHTEYQVRLRAPSLSFPPLADEAEGDAVFYPSTPYFVLDGYLREIMDKQREKKTLKK